ncbi:sel1 repeat family protein [Moraxella sp. PS-22]|uniref:Sel1 repeat family protein n=1 Tax=Moraxella tetraodonis TaxID=2767221 RepID=A0A9X2A4A5_9GAMM|nr:sel1 repeat family protein [Moraxella tetraodonis]MCG8147064.1 sel1 repeat family protein [Moraxella tetraodonis]
MTHMVKPLAYTLAILMATNATVAMAATATAKTTTKTTTTKTTTAKPATQTTATKKTTVTKAKTTNKSTEKSADMVNSVKDTTPQTTPPSATSNTGSMIVPVLTAPTVANVMYPSTNSVQLVGTDISAQNLANIPLPTLTLSNISTIKTVLVPRTTDNITQLDVSVLDDFITYATPMARHYPPVFSSRTERYNTTERLKSLTAWIETYAQNPNASYEVLLRAAKLNAMGRNLDLGSDYAVRAGNYIARAVRLNDTAEANFLYGAMLAEGGGFKEGAKYLEKAEKMGYLEATQSLAQADLLDDKKDRAIQRLTEFKAKNPDNPYIDEQLRIVNSGKYYIWDIPAKVVQ